MGRRRNGVVYTYLACKHSRGLPEEQQVPTDTTTEKVAWLYTSARTQDTHRESRRRIRVEYLEYCDGIRNRNSHPVLTRSLVRGRLSLRLKSRFDDVNSK